MANPRRSSFGHVLPTASNPPPLTSDQPPPTSYAASLISSVAVFLKRPHAFPFLLSVFVLLTWVSLRFQANPQQLHYDINLHHVDSSYSISTLPSSSDSDVDANVVRFSSLEFPSQIFKDKRGWLLNPVSAAQDAGISGGAVSCISVHVGEIRPGGMRGNHRHYTCNETFIIWGAETRFRLENSRMSEKGFAEVTIGVNEVAIGASPSGTAHALINIDPARTTFFMGCQDNVISNNISATDFSVWKDL